MADINNFTEISENFDTIKTLLNSIRAQGILNTSDVDKLLSGINAKLEKLNTEEDIDLIKIFLSELKQNLEERHSVLLSKFGAIESLFSNLLKNSSDMLKSSEAKELFDIVATNLSVFSREVVAQKEALSDISLRLDAMRSDDSQKKDIIKNISFLKNDLERLNNGFDSIVLSLNENFKTIIKTISSVDQSEAISQFGREIADIANSSNTILSALQMLDKKNSQLEEAMQALATQEDISSAKKWLSDLVAKNHELTGSIENLADKYYKIDNLAEKIDASVNIIAGLKTIIEDNDEQNTNTILDRINILEAGLKDIRENKSFEDFKVSLESLLNEILNGSVNLQSTIVKTGDEIQKIDAAIKSLDININFQNILSNLNKTEQDIKEHVSITTEKLSQIVEVNSAKTLNELSANADSLTAKVKEVQHIISGLCEKNFLEITDNIVKLKSVVAQIDENNVSANNAIFSNITDRLAVFENSLKTSLDKQEESVANSSSKLIEEMENVKNLSGALDYKLDSSVIELNNAKREFTDLKSAVENVLALDFVNTVKDLRVDLYAIKQDLSTAVETSGSDLADRFSKDLFGKYELLISKLDSAEDEIKQTQAAALNNMKNVLDNISASLIDILSYVSDRTELNTDSIDIKLADIAESVKESNLNYVENVRDVVEVIRKQVENNLLQIQKDFTGKVDSIKNVVTENTEALRNEIKYSYNKLLEVQDSFKNIKDSMEASNTSIDTNLKEIITSSDNLKAGFELKLSAFKNELLEKVAEFKQEFTCENADKFSELKFASENLNTKSIQNAADLKNELRDEITLIIDNLKNKVRELSVQLTQSVENLEKSGQNIEVTVEDKTQSLLDSFSELGENVNSLSSAVSSSLTATLAQILDNFVALKALINNLNDKASADLQKNIEILTEDFSKLRDSITSFDKRIDEDLAMQVSIIEGNFESLLASVSDLFTRSDAMLALKIDSGFTEISGKISDAIANKLEQYRSSVESLCESLFNNGNEQAEILKEKIVELDNFFKANVEEQNKSTTIQLENLVSKLKDVVDSNIKLTVADYNSLKTSLKSFLNDIESKNVLLAENLKAQLDDITKYIDTGLDIQSQDVINKFEEISSYAQNILTQINGSTKLIDSKISLQAQDLNNKFAELTTQSDNLSEQLNNISKNINSELVENSQEILSELDSSAAQITTRIDAQTQEANNKFDEITSKVQGVIAFLQNFENNFENKTDDVNNAIEAYKAAAASSAETTTSAIISSLTDISTKLSDKYNESLASILSASSETKDFIGSSLENQIKDVTELIQKSTDTQHDNLTIQANSILDKLQNIQSYTVKQTAILQETLADNELYDKIQSLLEEHSLSLTTQNSNLSSALNVLINEIKDSVDEKFNLVMSTSTDISAGELQTIEAFTNRILEQIEISKKNAEKYNDLISELIKKDLDAIAGNIEKETDLIIKDLIEQFSLLKDYQKDELAQLTVHIESTVEDYIYNHLNDLKSYLDVKTDSTVLDNKIDNLKNELNSSVDEVLDNLNKMLETSVFSSALSDFKTANEILLNSMADKLNAQVQEFIKENISNDINEKFALFDKKFIDTLVDKYEEIKISLNEHISAFNKMQMSVSDIISKFNDTKNEISSNITSLISGINDSIGGLSKSFADLKAQILNKSFDEAFQASINKQISGIESLIREQFGYLEDINELCGNNLPELTEMNTLVKYGIQQSVKDLSEKLNTQDEIIEKELNEFKSEIITQFINVFNQVSFVAEQEEILDFIQEKHSELITILSHIVTTSDNIETVKDNLALVDNKMDSLKEDIDLINEKITSIISSDGDINYVYSLQDLESDIANLRLVLNEMKEDSKSKEFDELISSTNDIHKLVESIKTEIPKFELEEFKRDFDALNEDIVSISTRTNKLILASDESYKTLQDNLQDFKLVINDLDERTRNFAHEAGIDRIDNKLGSINTMIQNGAKTNQVFNQVFEYLAEWVDKAGEEISKISDRVETLDDIGQIKVMLEDLKAEAEDDSESTELIEALSNVFEKQAKRISSLEAKLDRVIVETTINNKNNKIDMTPFEETLNRFLVAIDERMVSQQERINSLETKLDEVMSLIDPKDTAQLTKKVGGMDRQIAKLNKSIEKIASHVVEK